MEDKICNAYAKFDFIVDESNTQNDIYEIIKGNSHF